ncbi:MAG TPA: flavodoxin domain-containing protein, partial [Steroidobacteraceae bacterium]|nr:flavodoxin domain-containing protein [Steroidobacteraceae bacterium]
MSITSATALPLGPLDRERSELLLRVVEGQDPAVLQWISGFAAGVAHERAATVRAASPAATPVPAARAEASARLAIVYGTQTGNGKRVAERLARAAEAAGLAVRLSPAGGYPIKDLAQERLLVVVMSTHGDGDPPDDARGFIEYLGSRRAPRLEQLTYSVLALGDSSYPRFCATGREVEERLAALGARRLVDRADCDVDFERVASPWVERVVLAARDALGAPAVATVTRLRSLPTVPQYSREQPFAAEVLANQPVTARQATKEVRHIELSLAGSGLKYEPGDALGVWHENPPRAVEAILAALRSDGSESVEFEGRTRSLRD